MNRKNKKALLHVVAEPDVMLFGETKINPRRRPTCPMRRRG